MRISNIATGLVIEVDVVIHVLQIEEDDWQEKVLRNLSDVAGKVRDVVEI